MLQRIRNVLEVTSKKCYNISRTSWSYCRKMIQHMRTVLEVTARRCYNISRTSWSYCTKMIQHMRTVLEVTARRCYNVSRTSWSYCTKMIQCIRNVLELAAIRCYNVLGNCSWECRCFYTPPTCANVTAVPPLQGRRHLKDLCHCNAKSMLVFLTMSGVFVSTHFFLGKGFYLNEGFHDLNPKLKPTTFLKHILMFDSTPTVTCFHHSSGIWILVPSSFNDNMYDDFCSLPVPWKPEHTHFEQQTFSSPLVNFLDLGFNLYRNVRPQKTKCCFGFHSIFFHSSLSGWNCPTRTCMELLTVHVPTKWSGILEPKFSDTKWNLVQEHTQHVVFAMFHFSLAKFQQIHPASRICGCATFLLRAVAPVWMCWWKAWQWAKKDRFWGPKWQVSWRFRVHGCVWIFQNPSKSHCFKPVKTLQVFLAASWGTVPIVSKGPSSNLLAALVEVDLSRFQWMIMLVKQ